MTKARTLADNYAADINQVTADAPLTGGGTSGTVTVGIQDGTTAQKGAVQLEDSTASTSTTKASTPNSVKSAYDLANGAIAKSIVDAKGDLIVATGADTVSRLAVASTAGYLLSVDSGETTGLKWTPAPASGSLTLLSTTSLAGVSTVTISNISQDYTHLEIFVEDFDMASNDKNTSIRFNGDTGSNYWSTLSSQNTDSFTTSGEMGNWSNLADGSFIWGVIPHYANANINKIFNHHRLGRSSTGASWYTQQSGSQVGWKATPAAITSITIFNSTDNTNFDAGSVKIYGVK